jgi:hypothetical protein
MQGSKACDISLHVIVTSRRTIKQAHVNNAARAEIGHRISGAHGTCTVARFCRCLLLQGERP